MLNNCVRRPLVWQLQACQTFPVTTYCAIKRHPLDKKRYYRSPTTTCWHTTSATERLRTTPTKAPIVLHRPLQLCATPTWKGACCGTSYFNLGDNMLMYNVYYILLTTTPTKATSTTYYYNFNIVKQLVLSRCYRQLRWGMAKHIFVVWYWLNYKHVTRPWLSTWLLQPQHRRTTSTPHYYELQHDPTTRTTWLLQLQQGKELGFYMDKNNNNMSHKLLLAYWRTFYITLPVIRYTFARAHD